METTSASSFPGPLETDKLRSKDLTLVGKSRVILGHKRERCHMLCPPLPQWTRGNATQRSGRYVCSGFSAMGEGMRFLSLAPEKMQ